MLHPHLAAVRQLDQTFGQSAGRVPTNIELEQTAKQLRGISKQVELHHREVKPTHSLMPQSHFASPPKSWAPYPLQVLHQSKLKISLSPFESRTEMIDGIAMLPVKAQEETDKLEGVASDRQLMLLRLLCDMGSYDEEAVVILLADKALRERQTNFLQRVVVDNCREFSTTFRSGDLFELTDPGGSFHYKIRSIDPARSHIELDVVIEEGDESLISDLDFPIRLYEPLSRLEEEDGELVPLPSQFKYFSTKSGRDVVKKFPEVCCQWSGHRAYPCQSHPFVPHCSLGWAAYRNGLALQEQARN